MDRGIRDCERSVYSFASGHPVVTAAPISFWETLVVVINIRKVAPKYSRILG